MTTLSSGTSCQVGHFMRPVQYSTIKLRERRPRPLLEDWTYSVPGRIQFSMKKSRYSDSQIFSTLMLTWFLWCAYILPVLTRGRAEEFTKCVGKVAAAVVAYLGANGFDRDICLGQHA